MPATVADCERLQAEWNDATALAGGGSVNFPRAIAEQAAARGVEFARENGARIARGCPTHRRRPP